MIDVMKKNSHERTVEKPILHESPKGVQHTDALQLNPKDYKEAKETHSDYPTNMSENIEPDLDKVAKKDQGKKHTSVINARRGKYSGYSHKKKPVKLRKLETMKKIENFAASRHMKGHLADKGTNGTDIVNNTPSAVSRLEQLLQDSDDEGLY